jgi:NADPH-dependent 2,4-dienoyl-CoA reductase/sulfur reductase-like enzyme
MIEDTVEEAKYFYHHGFDMVNLRQSFLTKNRTDKYGGKSIKNRARFAIELCQAIKKECGQDFLIWYPVTVVEPWVNLPAQEDLYNMDEINDIIALAKELEDYVDILEIRDAGANTAFTMDETDLPLAVRVTQAIKESNANIPVATNGGFRDLDLNEKFIATGKTDLISMGRPFICDWEYGKKAYEGRGEDAVPCIMCNKCHGISNSSDWYTVCSVNPKIAIEPAMRGIEAPTVSRKVAVIGGGPAGMKAAITAVERGHRVTLYEKSGALGGLLMHADFFPYKWPLRNYKDYLIKQVYKVGVEVLLNTAATPEMIKAKGYEAILVGVGADLVIPRIPGVDGSNVYNVISVCGKEKSLGENVVVIGAGETGTEAGMYLSKSGHNVTIMTSERELVKNNRVHYPSEIIDAYKRLDNLTPITEAVATRISKGEVTYRDAKGSERSIKADSVVVYSGTRPRKDEALKFYGSAKRFFIIGECSGVGFGVQKTTRNAFFAASQI